MQEYFHPEPHRIDAVLFELLGYVTADLILISNPHEGEKKTHKRGLICRESILKLI